MFKSNVSEVVAQQVWEALDAPSCHLNFKNALNNGDAAAIRALAASDRLSCANFLSDYGDWCDGKFASTGAWSESSGEQHWVHDAVLSCLSVNHSGEQGDDGHGSYLGWMEDASEQMMQALKSVLDRLREHVCLEIQDKPGDASRQRMADLAASYHVAGVVFDNRKLYEAGDLLYVQCGRLKWSEQRINLDGVEKLPWDAGEVRQAHPVLWAVFSGSQCILKSLPDNFYSDKKDKLVEYSSSSNSASLYALINSVYEWMPSEKVFIEIIRLCASGKEDCAVKKFVNNNLSCEFEIHELLPLVIEKYPELLPSVEIPAGDLNYKSPLQRGIFHKYPEDQQKIFACNLSTEISNGFIGPYLSEVGRSCSQLKDISSKSMPFGYMEMSINAVISHMTDSELESLCVLKLNSPARTKFGVFLVKNKLHGIIKSMFDKGVSLNSICDSAKQSHEIKAIYSSMNNIALAKNILSEMMG